jgi:hypothetical protein
MLHHASCVQGPEHLFLPHCLLGKRLVCSLCGRGLARVHDSNYSWAVSVKQPSTPGNQPPRRDLMSFVLPEHTTPQQTSKQASNPASKQESQQASQEQNTYTPHTHTHTHTHTSTPTHQHTSTQAHKHTSTQANTQTNARTTTQTNKQTNTRSNNNCRMLSHGPTFYLPGAGPQSSLPHEVMFNAVCALP